MKKTIYSIVFSILTIYTYGLNGYNSENKKSVPEPKKISETKIEGALSHSSFLEKIDREYASKESTHSFSEHSSYHEFDYENIENAYQQQSTNDNQGIKEAKTTFLEIEESENWVDILDERITEFPVGVVHKQNNFSYAVGFTKAKIGVEYTELTVFVRITTPWVTDTKEQIQLFAGAKNVRLSNNGGIIGDPRAVLLGDFHLPLGDWLITFRGGFDYKTGNTEDLTYISFDCNGFKNMEALIDVEISRNAVIPTDKNGTPEAATIEKEITNSEGKKIKVQIPNRVRATTWMHGSNLNDILVNLNFDQSFVLASWHKKATKNKRTTLVFNLHNAIFDFSDLKNDPNMRFPQYYYDQGLLLPNANAWRGIYIQKIEVGLPEEFKTEKIARSGGRIILGAEDLIIDNNGLSGFIYEDNLIPLGKGVTGKSKSWAYSVDHIGIELAASNLVGGELGGEIVLPIAEPDLIETEQKGEEKKEKKEHQTKNNRLRYKGVFSEDEYLLSVKLENSLNFKALGAKIELYRNSSVELKVINKQFEAKAVLNGRMAISKSQKASLEEKNEDGSLVNFKGIEFNHMVFQTRSPVFSVDYLGYRGEVKFANFPVSISNIELYAHIDNHPKLMFDLVVNLMEKGISGKTNLAIKLKGYEKNFKQHWKFDGIDINAIAIKADFKAVQFEGKIEVFEADRIYGKGFSGTVNVKLLGVEGIDVIKAKALFAQMGHRFWFVDFLAPLPAPIPIAPPLSIAGIGGGFSHGMVIDSYKPEQQYSKGASISGLKYTPDQNAGLGFRAMAALVIPNVNSFSGQASLGILFNRHGGLRKIDFFGYAELMFKDLVSINLELDLKKMIKLPEFLDKKGNGIKMKATLLNKKLELGGVKGDLSLSYDFQNKTLHGESNFYINVLEGVIKGIGKKGRAGWAVLHFSPQDWYLYLGTPNDPIGIGVGVGPIRAKAGGYFMIGTKVLGSPPPPPIVAEILGVDATELDYMRDLNALGTGSGFAFGLNFSVDTGDITFLILYARFQAGAGFDIMLKDYGNARCKGRSGTIGINGWYANGQAYVYLQGELGIKIKLFFVNKKIPIIKAGVAALLQAQAPDPIWLRGYLGGHYNLLGGLIKGRFRFKLTLGKQCELINASPLGGVKIITGLTPRDGSSNVDVFSIPQAAFSMKVGESLVIPEEDGDKTYKIILEKYRVLYDGKEIKGIIEWNSNKDRANFVSDDILPPNRNLSIEAKVSFKEKKGGVFRTLYVDGKKAVEVEKRNFKTGKAPNRIPLKNILYAYPVLNQKYFLEDEHKTAYIKLKKGQDYLFETDKWKSTIFYTDDSGNEREVAFNYDTAKNIVGHLYPDLKQQKSYAISIVSVPTTKSKGASDSEYIEQYDEENVVKIKSKRAEELIKKGGTQRLAYEFTTSKYKTFRGKVRAISPKHYDWGRVFSDVINLSVRTSPHEGFDLVELIGDKYTKGIPLVEAKALLDDDYYKKDIWPYLYASYPLGNRYYLTQRDVKEYGVPPAKALNISSIYMSKLQHGVDRIWREKSFPYSYDLPLIYKKDFVDLKSQVSNAFINEDISSSSDPALKILNVKYKFIRYGRYNIRLQYILPGGKRGSSSQFYYKNTIR